MRERMTREEAIKIIDTGKKFAYDDKYVEAFDLAIEALKAEPCKDCHKAEEIMQTLYDYGCELKIQDAISQVLETEYTKYGDVVKRESVLNTLDTMDAALDENRTVEAYKELLRECYKELPSVTHKSKPGQWIAGPTIGDGFTCSKCNAHYRMYPMSYRFCPMCGDEKEGDTE